MLAEDCRAVLSFIPLCKVLIGLVSCFNNSECLFEQTVCIKRMFYFLYYMLINLNIPTMQEMEEHSKETVSSGH